jgi:hypothetical protein
MKCLELPSKCVYCDLRFHEFFTQETIAVKCRACGGTGKEFLLGERLCFACEGFGTIRLWVCPFLIVCAPTYISPCLDYRAGVCACDKGGSADRGQVAFSVPTTAPTALIRAIGDMGAVLQFSPP